jgi:hypothetical protein
VGGVFGGGGVLDEISVTCSNGHVVVYSSRNQDPYCAENRQTCNACRAGHIIPVKLEASTSKGYLISGYIKPPDSCHIL